MSPPRQDEFFCIGRKCFPSPRNIIPQFPFRGINIINEESLADVLASDKKGMQKRTYTVGLRVPNSLQSDLSALVRQREVLQFFMHHTTKKLPRTFEGFLRYKNMQNSQKKNMIEEYSRYFQDYSRLNPSTLAQEVKGNGQEINSLSPKAKSRNWQKFQVPNTLPKINNMANPLPSEISLRDYQYIANHSFKRVCSHLNNEAESMIYRLLASKRYTRRDIANLSSTRTLDKATIDHGSFCPTL